MRLSDGEAARRRAVAGGAGPRRAKLFLSSGLPASRADLFSLRAQALSARAAKNAAEQAAERGWKTGVHEFTGAPELVSDRALWVIGGVAAAGFAFWLWKSQSAAVAQPKVVQPVSSYLNGTDVLMAAA